MTYLPLIVLFTIAFMVCGVINLIKLFFRKPWFNLNLWLLNRRIDKLARKILEEVKYD